MKRVNLGSGNIKHDGWINVDINPGEFIDIVHDLREPLPFKDGEIDEFYSHHVLEHFTPQELERLLKECLRCLKVRGKFNARLPDIEAAMKNFIKGNNQEAMMKCLYGEPDREPYCAHRHIWGWTPGTMRKVLEGVGFRIEKVEAIDSDNLIPSIDIIATKEI